MTQHTERLMIQSAKGHWVTLYPGAANDIDHYIGPILEAAAKVAARADVRRVQIQDWDPKEVTWKIRKTLKGSIPPRKNMFK